jgi:hypothetical protein
MGGSSLVVNTESWAMENPANTESRVTENSVNIENQVMQDSGGKKLEERKGAAPSNRPAPRWCPRVLPRHKNADCKRCIKESWLRKKKRNRGIIGLTVYGP